ncbi:predicted protein [Plenodomus lingam JN3]|uniref:Uncharacterized protein n=1 Tax=Leptosphaeria maculans (strain JN3 / isolate v23.1.3 / race Av1-4-5-6-7-8) TaxID=985895 RepID=E4ZGX3_LEPMJ|nr:predicted protein [Plenodomus lingam JN3]CBX90543.1 predicted protein [Plenodomus lingam JN3]
MPITQHTHPPRYQPSGSSHKRNPPFYSSPESKVQSPDPALPKPPVAHLTARSEDTDGPARCMALITV